MSARLLQGGMPASYCADHFYKSANKVSSCLKTSTEWTFANCQSLAAKKEAAYVFEGLEVISKSFNHVTEQ